MNKLKKKLKLNLTELLPICGIYKLTNRETGRVYIGQSGDIIGRWKQHVDCLIKGKHSNKLLAEDFNIYGLTSFSAEVLQVCSPEELLSLEAMYIIEYSKLAGVYNIIPADDRKEPSG